MKSNVHALLPAARVAVGVLLASLMSAGLAQAPAGAADKVVARLGAVTVAQSEVEQLLQGMQPAERAAAAGNRAGVENWLRQRAASEALLREARSKGFADRPEVKARIDAAVREVTARIVTTGYLESVAQVPAGFPSDAELKSAYDQAKSNFNVPVTYRIAQIFLAAPAGDSAAIAKAREEAKSLATQARKSDFAALAKTRSQDAGTAARGGEVGTLPLDQVLPEMRDTVAKLKAGQVSDPVQSPAGFHVMKLLETTPAHTATLEEVKPRLQAALRQQRQQQMVQAYMATLAPAESFTIDSAALDAALKKVN